MRNVGFRRILVEKLIKKLISERSLSLSEYERLIKERTAEAAEYLAENADRIRREHYGNSVYVRGLIEISNICKNDCYYCGIRKSNSNCSRYRLTRDEILACCDEGYKTGFRTFVMQGGEDGWYTDDILCEIISEIKSRYPDCAVTLSLGERSYESYKRLREAGADRYLLRHETADGLHYSRLHPENMSFEKRMECLRSLKSLGFQTGCGFMVGSPFQTEKNLALDLKFIEEFSPEMCGIGPFIPHSETPFSDMPSGSIELTCFLLSVIRIICPKILLPSTTALASLDKDGHIKGIRCGANVIMPNLSPFSVREKYMLYNNKAFSGSESAQQLKLLSEKLSASGYEIVLQRGDALK